MDSFFQTLLNYLLHTSPVLAILSFLLENVFIVFMVIVAGRWIQQLFAPHAIAYSYTSKDWLICITTVVLNTLVTYIGFCLWKEELIELKVSFSLYIILDFVILFLAMDLLMYVFHFFIHKTSLHKAMHELHHRSVNPKPIDLFVLHPVETLSFGSLWLLLLLTHTFNFYSVIIYLIVNVIFGMVGHLGIEPLPARLHNHYLLKFFGTSTFHHQHHQEVNYNFGFYTTIWDRLFGTLK